MSASEIDVAVHRPIYSRKQFEIDFSIDSNVPKQNCSLKLVSRLKKLAQQYHPKNLLGLFTIFNLISEYRLKEYLANDIVSGLTGI